MPIAANASNLFFNRDTKLFVGQSAGRPIAIGTTAITSNAYTATAAHGLTSGDRVVFTGAVPTGLTAPLPTANTIYYAIVASTTTVKLAATYANAIAGTPVPILTTSAGVIGTATLHALDSYITPTAAVVSGTNLLTITATHFLTTSDYVQVSGISDVANLDCNGVYKVASVTGTTSFTLTLVGATNATLTNLSNIRIHKMNLWEVPVQSGYSMSQSTTTSEVTLNEMVSATGVSRRGRQMFNDALAPVEWSIETYARPFKSTNHYCVEEPLWASVIGKTYSTVSGTGSSQLTTWMAENANVVRDANDLEFSFADSNTVTLGTLDLFFVMGASRVSGKNYAAGTDGGSTTIYRIADAVVNEVSMGFEIDAITSISWSGMGSTITELGHFNGTDAGIAGTTSNSNFIRNRLTALYLEGVIPTTTIYNITLTGGSINISNGITYLTPELLGVVNKPIGHVTGTRSVSGSFTCYMDEVTGGSIDLFQDLAQKGDSTITNQFKMDFYIGGGANDVPIAPGIQIDMNQVHLEIPNINFDDVVTCEVNFHALPSTVGGTNEINVIRYRGN